MLKRVFSMFIVLVLIFGMSGTVSAEEITSGTITVRNVTKNTVLHLYKILRYEYADATLNYNHVHFTNPTYYTVFKNQVEVAYAANPTGLPNPNFSKAPSEQDILLYITNNLKDSSGFAADLAKALKPYLTDGANFTSVNNASYKDNVLTFKGIDMGYYLMEDVTQPALGEKYTPMLMLQPTKPNIDLTLKSIVYTPIEKELDGHDNSFNVGDKVDFKISAVVPNEGERDFKYTIADTMSAGLTFNNDVVITVNQGEANEKTIPFATVTKPVQGSETFRIEFDQTLVQPGDKLIITYSARLNEQAITEGDGKSTNKVVDYGNNPNKTLVGDPVVVEVYTYGIKVTKVNEKGDKLTGVKFYLKNADKTKYAKFEGGKFAGFKDTKEEATELVTDANGIITLLGLDKGTYYLEETYTLPGYNKLASDEQVVVDGKIKSPNGDALIDIVLEPVKVINLSGVNLPSTGGIGTVWFKGVGMMTMLSAAVILFRNRKRLFV